MTFYATNTKFDTLEEANAYNKKNSEAKLVSGCGCLSTFCCENCYTVIADTICCCIAVAGPYTCPQCGYEKPDMIKLLSPFFSEPYMPFDTMKEIFIIDRIN